MAFDTLTQKDIKIKKPVRYKGFSITVKKGEQKHTIEKTTNDPFDWFPELKRIFKTFSIKSMEFEVSTDGLVDKNISRAIFKIKREK